MEMFTVYGNNCGPQSHFFLSLGSTEHLFLLMRLSGGFEFETPVLRHFFSPIRFKYLA
jgi:hypothetical protein